ncbi:MAG: hypothetical protein LW698_07280 [Planctomycetaceae bacterium]|nr:hypothetical protein [Planctomycetaceae bacterium]
MNDRGTGGCQTEQPELGEEVIWPPLVIKAPADAGPLLSLAENAPQAAPYIPIHAREHVAVGGVLEVGVPATEDRMYAGNHALQAIARRSSSARPYGVAEILQALLAWPVILAAEGVAQEVEAVRTGVDDPSLRRMQCEAVVGNPLPDDLQRPSGFFCRLSKDHEVVGITNHLELVLGQQMVERIEIDPTAWSRSCPASGCEPGETPAGRMCRP